MENGISVPFEQRMRLLEAGLILVGATTVAGCILVPRAGLLALAGCGGLWFVVAISDWFRAGLDGAVLCWAASFPLSYFVNYPRDHPAVTLQRVVVLGAFLGLAFVKPSSLMVIPKPLRRAGLACLAFFAVAAITLQRSPDRLGSARVLVDGFLLPVLFGWYIIVRFDVRRWLPRVHTAVCLSSLMCAALAAAEIVTGEDLLPYEGSALSYTAGIARPNGPFSTNDALALVGAISLFFLLFLGATFGPKLSAGRRVLHYIGVAAALGMALMPMFRSVALTLLLVLIIDTFWERRATRRACRVALITACMVLIVVLRAFAPEVYEERSGADNVLARVAQYQQSLRVFADHPVLGVGFSNFNNFVTGEHRYLAFYEGVAAVDSPHSNLTAVLAETGLLGFLPYAMTHALLLGALWGVRRVSASGRVAWKYFAYIFATYWITGLTETSGYDAFLNLWYVFVITVSYKYVLTDPDACLARGAPAPARHVSVPGGTFSPAFSIGQRPRVFVLVLAGQESDALAFAQRRYPACEAVVVSKTELRECDWKSRLRKLWQLKGEALLIFTDSLKSLREPLLLKCTVLVHRCRVTVLADSSSSCEVSTRLGLLRLLPRSTIAAFADLVALACCWVALQIFQLWLRFGREPEAGPALMDLAFLYPSQAGLDAPGGAQTHVTGFLSGLTREGARATVFSGQPLQAACEVRLISGSRRCHLFREAATLCYNIRFVAAVYRLLARSRARLLYQRHGRFVFAGAVLSRVLGIPLVLEYNGSEEWIAKHWDPARFSAWLRLCEKVSIRAASLITVVSNPLKQQLMEIGVPKERILVNPNAVDPEWFHPECGGASLRRELGFRPEDVVVCFVGTFSYWHGVEVLAQAIRSLLDNQAPPFRLKFLLVGDGLLAPQLRSALGPYAAQGLLTFTGAVPHRSVRAYLDAADILVSPHVPMPDSNPFFGSPTKLFEYMAMGKAIAASALDQIADVLEDGKTALLVRPGDPGELAAAVQRLAADASLRAELGHNALEAALARHTWQQNAQRVLAHYRRGRYAYGEANYSAVAEGPSRSRSSNLAEQH